MEYAAAKRRESVVDFEDLQLAARDLLRDDEDVREATRLRFRMVMVDEFQDTNRLQCEVIDLVAHPDLTEVFTVGDEFQSIYGFRHADLEVFRERRAEAPSLLALTQNYRSRPQVLDAVNHLFADAFGDDFQPLSSSAEFSDPVFGHPVELLVTDKTSFAGTGEHWRQGEARRIASRVRELVDSGEADPGEIVVLFAAGTDAERYEEALRREGLPTYRATGRGYFGQQQVVDLLAYLRLLHNRYDDVALATVLASPFVGVSNDALVLIRRNATRRPLFTALERALPEHLAESDERLLRAFLQRYERLVRASARVGLEALCERIVSEHDYDLAVLARWDGGRRFANLRKLGRLARDYEAIRGADIAGFVRFVREQDALGAKELEAVAEEEGGGAVRLLTIHAAKGLEFKIVIVADAGRDIGGPRGTGRDRRALGRSFRVPHGAPHARPARAGVRLGRGEGGRERAGACRAASPLLRRDDARDRPPHRLRRDRSRANRRPIDADRLGARPARRHDTVVEAGEHADRARARRGALRSLGQSVSSHGVEEALEPPTPMSTPTSCSSRCSTSFRPAVPGSASSFRRSRRSRRRRRTTFGACRTALSHSSSAARTATSPSECSGCRRASHRSNGERAGLAATEIGDAVHRLLEHRRARRSTRPLTRASSSAQSASGTRTCRRRSSIGSPRLVDAYCQSDLARRMAGLAVRGPSGRSRSSTTASSFAVASTSSGEKAQHAARRRLQVERARGPVACRDHRVRVHAAAARVRARLPACGCERGRGRVPVSRAAERRRRRRRSRSRTSPLWRPSSRLRSRASATATSARRRASSSARTARRSISCAPGRGSHSRGNVASCASRRSATSTGTCPALEAVLADIDGEGVDEIVVVGDTAHGPWAAEVVDLLVERGARCVRGNADREVTERSDRNGQLAPWSADRLGERRLAVVRSWPLTLDLSIDGLGGVLVCHSTPLLRRSDLHANHARRRTRWASSSPSTRTSSSVGTPTCSSTARSRRVSAS